MITHITLKNFKKVKQFDSDLGKINILVEQIIQVKAVFCRVFSLPLWLKYQEDI